MIKKSLLLAGILPLAGVGIANAQQEKPNIIYILSDDMGIGDVSCYGSRLLTNTPHIDKMAAEGIRFTQFYSASPISSPSRTGLLTGQNPGRWNITSYLQTRAGNKAAEMANFLDPKAHTLPRTLKNAGYRTGHFGKWHLGGGRDVTDAPSILKYGYDEYVSTYESPDPDPLLTDSNWIWSTKDKIKRWDRTNYFVVKTINFLKANQGQPCFVNLWPDDMHTPWVGNKEEMGHSDSYNSMFNFNSVLTEYDRQIGLFFELLKKEGLDKNTIVIFSSDNGPDPSFNHIRTNGLRGLKASLFEGGIRMPFIVWGTDNLIPKGKVDETSVVTAMDMFHSLSKIGGAELPIGYVSDGQDMSQALKGIPLERTKAIYWEYKRSNNESFPSPKGPDESPTVCVREGDWKLLVNVDNKRVILFNLKDDVYETDNVAKRYPEITKRLRNKALAWRKSLPKLK